MGLGGACFPLGWKEFQMFWALCIFISNQANELTVHPCREWKQQEQSSEGKGRAVLPMKVQLISDSKQ